MCEEKRNDDRPEEGGTLNSGGPESTPREAIHLQRIHVDQPKEDDVQGHRESACPP
jgi:hypothetical protein